MTSNNNITTLWITKTNHTRMQKIGNKGETYNDILTKLLNVYEDSNNSRYCVQNASTGGHTKSE